MNGRKRFLGRYLLALIIIFTVLAAAAFLFIVQGSLQAVNQMSLSAPTAANEIAVAQTRLNAVLVVVTILYLLATVVIAWASIQAAQQAASSAEGSKESAKRADTALDETRKQGRFARETAELQIAEMRRQAEASRESAAAAQETARQLQAQRAAAVRPYVIFSHEDPEVAKCRKAWEVGLLIRNVGRGPALNVQTTVVPIGNSWPLPTYGWTLVWALSENESQTISVSFPPKTEVNMPSRDTRVWGIVRCEYMDVEGSAWASECQLLLGPVDVLPDRQTPREGYFPISLEPNTTKFRNISQLTGL